ncbi:MAG: glycoside hydrolase family 32 protein [Chitinophagaceae bacterium]|nr:glycoside hydrolase family 32 protein [Chitinophagaceae bacterium]
MKNLAILILIIFFFSNVYSQPAYKEKYRPQFHFTPAKNWMNDPNGLVYHNGEYHLFYQHNPFGNRWGHMSWGHAVSNNLMHWKHLPVAISEKDSVAIFSGSAVIDKTNTTGFAKNATDVPMVAIYTAHIIADSTKPDNYRQEQHIAYSLDNGRTFTKYSGNPVLDIGKKDFRDPKVFWHEPTKKWIMLVVLAQEHIIKFYSSPDLKKWTHTSDFGPAGDYSEIWECSDLLEVSVENEPGNKKWVLINSQQYGMQYFVGEFDGNKFVSKNPANKIYRPDYGPDYYAGITYNNLPDGHPPILIGWINNWKYANDIPTDPWKSAMAFPRMLSLEKRNNEWILLSNPFKTTPPLVQDAYMWELQVKVKDKQEVSVNSQTIAVEIEWEVQKNTTAGIRLAVNGQRGFVIGYDARSQKLFIDRSNASDTNFHKGFNEWSKYEASLVPKKGRISLQILYDKSIVEVFANNGEVNITAQIFPDEKNNGIEVFSKGGTTKFTQLTVSTLKSVW